jgi:hypothetical protein
MDPLATRRSGPAIVLGVALVGLGLPLLVGRSAAAKGSDRVATASASPIYWKNYRKPATIEPTRININYRSSGLHTPSVTWGSDCRGAQIKAP